MDLLKRDDAVSPVIASVLVFALAVTAFGLWSTTQLPAWIEDNEEIHSAQVMGSMQDIKSSLEALAATNQVGPTSSQVQLSAQPVPFFQGQALPGSIAVDGTWGMDASFPSSTAWLTDGHATGLPSASISNSLFTNVGSTEALRLSLTTTGVTAARSAWAQVSMSDGAETVTATLTHRGQLTAQSCSGAEINLRVTSSTTGTVFDQAILCEVEQSVTGLQVNLFESEYGFSQAITRLEPGYIVNLVDGGGGGATVDGKFVMAYKDPDGFDYIAGTGVSATTNTFTQSGQVLHFRPTRLHYVDQDIRYEGGAIVVDQHDGSAIASAPPIVITEKNGQGFITLTAPAITGSGARGGLGSATVTIQNNGGGSTVLTTSTGTISVTTETPSAWTTYIQERILAAGLESDLSVASPSATTSELTITSTTVSNWTIRLQLLEAVIRVA